MIATTLSVDGNKKLSTELLYDDLAWLYRNYINHYGKVPTIADCVSKNNLPQGRIVNKILNQNNITYNDFINQFGKYSHVRTKSKDYDLFVKKFKDVCNLLNKTLTINELKNNAYGLPSASWFIKYCPDKTVKTYNDFLIWCGYDAHNSAIDKDYIIIKLKQYEKDLHRPIVQADITYDKIGFSMIAINRIWGGLSKCKENIGLMSTPTSRPESFEYYKNNLDSILYDLKKQKTRSFISWKDIENSSICKVNHKTLIKSFNKENVDLFAYIKSQGFLMNPSSFSYHYTFDDGERVLSSMEYDFSLYLRQLGLQYNVDYLRDIPYKTFTNVNKSSKMTCDYKINNLYIEIAGIIKYFDDWRTHVYSSQKENEYRDKMIIKQELLFQNNVDYLFLFPDDFIDEEYKKILERRLSYGDNSKT